MGPMDHGAGPAGPPERPGAPALLPRGTGVAESHWASWHEPYDDPDSPLSARLEVVKAHLRGALGRGAPGPIRIVSLCAGQGRDVIDVLAAPPPRPEVTARLVEADEANAAFARRAARTAGLTGIEVVTGDASTAAAYEGAVPAHVVMVCGVFGNISDTDIRSTVGHLHELCAPGATVIWTRHRRAPDRTPAIRRWFADAGFGEVRFDAPDGYVFAVGSQRLDVDPAPLDPDVKLFDFVGDGARPA